MARKKQKRVEPEVPTSLGGAGGSGAATTSAPPGDFVGVMKVPSKPMDLSSGGINTRRSLRNLKKHTDEEPQQKEVVESPAGAGETEEGGSPARKKRFLKETTSSFFRSPSKAERRQADETAAGALSRLISKRVQKPSVHQRGKVGARGGRFGLPGVRKPAVMQPQMKKRGRKPRNAGELTQPLPLKVEMAAQQTTEGAPGPAPVVTVSNVAENEPKKRGRKRKSETAPTAVFIKSEPAEEVQNKQPSVNRKGSAQVSSVGGGGAVKQKRGRQSAFTESVTPRFPFCVLCLSKDTPHDYIINYMSCPNEYQRMRRLFGYIYKDLKFPFLPFDLERENVFDYCDLPLCDGCIGLYRDIYDTYAKIEHNKDRLKSKIERMVHQIQLSEVNPQVCNQLSSIKNSPDPLMNKYCNFRRRFAIYRPGNSRSDVSGAELVPATIARVRVINPIPKRTAASQTVLSMAHFPPPFPPQTQSTAEEKNASASNQSPEPVKSTSGGPEDPALNKTSADGKEQQSGTKKNDQHSTGGETSIHLSVTSSPTKTSTVASGSVGRNAPIHSATATPIITSTVAGVFGGGNATIRLATASPTKTSTVASAATISPVTTKTVIPSSAPSIVKTNTCIIISKPPSLAPEKKIVSLVTASPSLVKKSEAGKSISSYPKQQVPVRPGSVPGPASGGNKTSPAASQSAPAKSSEPVLIRVKDEPVEEISTVDDPDPFLCTSNTTAQNQSNAVAKTVSVSELKAEAEPEPSDEDQSDTNVFRKHKKLRILPVPPYKKTPIDSVDAPNRKNPASEKTVEEVSGTDGPPVVVENGDAAPSTLKSQDESSN